MRSIFNRSALLILSMALFAASMFFEVCRGWTGWGVLLMGWVEIAEWDQVGPFVACAWFANPLLFTTWLLRYSKRQVAARICAVGALLISASYLLFGVSVVTDEAGQNSHAVTLNLAAAFWLASILVATSMAFLPIEEVDPADRWF